MSTPASYNTWSDKMPEHVGLWEIKCMETDDKPERVAISYSKGRFFVHDNALGVTPLKTFHDGLTNLQWMHIS